MLACELLLLGTVPVEIVIGNAPGGVAFSSRLIYTVTATQANQMFVKIDDRVGHIDQQAVDGCRVTLDQVCELLLGHLDQNLIC